MTEYRPLTAEELVAVRQRVALKEANAYDGLVPRMLATIDALLAGTSDTLPRDSLGGRSLIEWGDEMDREFSTGRRVKNDPDLPQWEDRRGRTLSDDAFAQWCPACHHPDHDPGSCPDCPRV